MNRRKWEGRNVPIPILALKLTEEVGEVAKEITDAHFNPSDLNNEAYRERILEELAHVRFLARTLSDRIINFNPHVEADRV